MSTLGTDEKIAVIKRAIIEGRTRNEIAALLGCVPTSVTRFMRQHGIKFGNELKKIAGARYAANMRAKRDAALPQIREMLARGVPPGEIIRALGISRTAYRRACDENGLIRPGSAKAMAAKPRKTANFIQRAGRRVAEVQAQRSLYVDAATLLAPHYRPVVRADIVDDPYSAPKGEPREYIVGTMRVPAVEMLDMARGLGFPA